MSSWLTVRDRHAGLERGAVVSWMITSWWAHASLSYVRKYTHRCGRRYHGVLGAASFKRPVEQQERRTARDAPSWTFRKWPICYWLSGAQYRYEGCMRIRTDTVTCAVPGQSPSDGSCTRQQYTLNRPVTYFRNEFCRIARTDSWKSLPNQFGKNMRNQVHKGN